VLSSGSAPRLLTLIAMAVALVAALLPPAIHLALAYANLSAEAQTRAAYLAEEATRLISTYPSTWQYQGHHRFWEIARRNPVAGESLVVRTVDGVIVARFGEKPDTPILTRAEPAHDSGVVAGSIEIERSMRALLGWTALAALAGLALGVAVFTTLRVLPLRALQRTTDALMQEKLRAQITLRSIGDAVITTDREQQLEYLNPVAEAMSGWTLAEAAGRPLGDLIRLVTEAESRPVASPAAIALAENRVVPVPGAVVLVRRDGATVPVEGIAAPIHAAGEDAPGGAVLVLHDVTRARQLARRLSYQASHDALTGLINRAEFERRLEDALASARNGQEHAVCYLDLDQFKIVNDTCGHFAGDELLRQIAARLRSRIRGADLVARLGGDEFGLLLYGCPPERARSIAESLLEAVRELRFVWHDKSFAVSASIGVASLTGASASAAEAMSSADATCYVAKNLGRNRVQLDAPEDRELSRQRGEMSYVSRITRALDEGQFVLYQQPVVPLQPGAAAGAHFEVLLRLVGEDGRHVPPGAFIPAAERYGLMPQIDRWTVGELFARYGELERKARLPLEMVSVNLSGTSLNDERTVAFILEQARRHAVPPEKICFELTETAALNNLQVAIEVMRALKREGFSLAIDDFGSGFTSFAYLKSLPVDFIKIDGSYVKGMLDDRVDRAMVTAIRQIAAVIGIRTVAEWVENAALAAELGAIGIDYAQGYGIARPAPLQALLGARLERVA
jgi:diguanylate cyclase (GGDEF)-like protein/PAS domain S-box-containing protein